VSDKNGIDVSVCTHNELVVVSVAGDAGIMNSDELARQLLPVVAMKPQVVVFDIEDLTFIASIGLSVLMEFQRGIAREGGHVRLLNPCPAVRDVLRKCRLDSVLLIIDSIDEAPMPGPVS
jgi:anti-anti-sigma factor